MTRGSVTGQVKALSMIVAMQNFIPDRRRAVSSETKPAPAPAKPQIYVAEWLREQQAKAIDPQQTPTQPVPPAPARRGACRGAQQEAQQEDSPGAPACPACPGVPRKPKHAPGSAGAAPPNPGPSQSTFANPLSPSQAPPVAPYGPGFSFVPDARDPFVPDTRIPFSIKKNPFARPR